MLHTAQVVQHGAWFPFGLAGNLLMIDTDKPTPTSRQSRWSAFAYSLTPCGVRQTAADVISGFRRI